MEISLKNKIDVDELYKKMQEGNKQLLIFPPPSFSMMQGGLIEAAVDNAVGSLSLLSAPVNITRNIETKFVKAVTLETTHIYVHARLCEQRKKRLTFEVTVQDENGEIFTKSKVINFIV